MKRITVFFIGIVVSWSAWAQLKLPQVRGLESEGWSVQHSVMSWDSLSIYFAAKEPRGTSYDLYVVRSDGWLWTKPERLSAICTPQDELWPSIGSDERMLFYVQVTPATGEMNSFEKTQIMRASQREGRWTEPAPIIISGEQDLRPRLLEDNRTLVFFRREESKHHDGAWAKWSSTMLDDHNWTFPIPASDTLQPKPILAVSGTLVSVKTGMPLTSGKVLVYDAATEQLMQSAAAHKPTGRWRVRLQADHHYRLALTADGYSYSYIDIPTQGLKVRKERVYKPIALDDELALSMQLYDSETQAIVSKQKKVLPLGKIHRLVLQQAGYYDTTLVVNTQRPTVFTETELDIAVRPKKSRQRFVVADAVTGTTIGQAQLLLDGRKTGTDTLMRLNEEHTLQVSAKGYIFHDTVFQTGKITQEHTVLIRLQPLTKDLVLQLRNIQFEHDSYQLTESSNEELEALAQLLFMNPTLRIELSSHTDDQGSDKYNDRLSTLRGQAVEKWLIERGVDTQRMVIAGYGKRKPLVPNDSDANRALNRRVEIKVLEF